MNIKILLLISFLTSSGHVYSMLKEKREKEGETTPPLSNEAARRATADEGDVTFPQRTELKEIRIFEQESYPNNNFNMNNITTISQGKEEPILPSSCLEEKKIGTFEEAKIEVKAYPIIRNEKMFEIEKNKSLHEITQVISDQKKIGGEMEPKISEEVFKSQASRSEKKLHTFVNEQKDTVESISASFLPPAARSEILKQAASHAEELIKHASSISSATTPIYRTLNKFRNQAIEARDDRTRDIIGKDMATINDFAVGSIYKIMLPLLSSVKEKVESRLVDNESEDVGKKNLEEDSYDDALLLTELNMASAALEKVTQETAAAAEVIMKNDRYRGALADESLTTMRALEAKRENLFKKMNELTTTLPLKPIDHLWPTLELKKEKLKQTIEYTEVLSRYAESLENEGLGDELYVTIYDCGEGTILDNDAHEILDAENQTRAVLIMSNIAVTKAKQYLEEIEKPGAKSSFSNQEEVQLFASLELTTSLLQDAAQHLGKTLNQLYKKYQDEWATDEGEENFLTLLRSIEAPYEAFIGKKK